MYAKTYFCLVGYICKQSVRNLLHLHIACFWVVTNIARMVLTQCVW